MNSSYTTTTTSTAMEAAIVLYLACILLFAVPSLITTWRLFKKAGKPGWAAIVPIYNYIVELQIAKMPTWYVVLMFVPLVNVVIGILILVNFAKQYNRKLGFWLAYIFLPIVAMFLVGKTQYTGGEAVAAAAPASPADTAALAPAPAESTPEPVSESAVPANDTAPTEPVATTQDVPVPAGETPAAPATFNMPEPTMAAPVEAPAEPVAPTEQQSAEPTVEEPVAQGFNMPSDPVVAPESEQPVQEEKAPDTTQQPPADTPQQPLQ